MKNKSKKYVGFKVLFIYLYLNCSDIEGATEIMGQTVREKVKYA